MLRHLYVRVLIAGAAAVLAVPLLAGILMERRIPDDILYFVNFDAMDCSTDIAPNYYLGSGEYSINDQDINCAAGAAVTDDNPLVGSCSLELDHDGVDDRAYARVWQVDNMINGEEGVICVLVEYTEFMALVYPIIGYKTGSGDRFWLQSQLLASQQSVHFYIDVGDSVEYPWAGVFDTDSMLLEARYDLTQGSGNDCLYLYKNGVQEVGGCTYDMSSDGSLDVDWFFQYGTTGTGKTGVLYIDSVLFSSDYSRDCWDALAGTCSVGSDRCMTDDDCASGTCTDPAPVNRAQDIPDL